MRSILLSVAFLAVVASAFAGGPGGGDPSLSIPGITDLTPDNFDKLVNGAKHAIVEFYAPWCGHCKAMVPELTKLGEMLQANPALKNRVVVGKVNADEYRELGNRFEVRGFPTIKYFKRGIKPNKDSESYNGARSAAKFIEFLQKQLDDDRGFARVEALDPIAKQFLEGDQTALLAEAKALEESITEEHKDNYALYIKFMTAAAEKGKEYIAKEHARLEKMLASGNVAAPKVDEFSRKVSVLSAFLPEPEPKEEVKEAASDDAGDDE